MNEYEKNVGRWATINSRHKTRSTGRRCLVVAFVWMGKYGDIPYYRVERIDGWHPNTSLLYKVQDIVFAEA